MRTLPFIVGLIDGAAITLDAMNKSYNQLTLILVVVFLLLVIYIYTDTFK